MADRRPPSYPPVGDDARYDRIVARGRSLQRRRQLTRVAGAGGALAVVALVAAMAVSVGSTSDDAVVADTPTTAAPTTTVEPAPEQGSLSIDVPDASPLQIVVTDLAQPVGPGTQQCLNISVYQSEAAMQNGALATHEGSECEKESGGARRVELPVVAEGSATEGGGVDLGEGTSVDGTNVGPCASQISNIEPETSGTSVGETTFVVTDLPSGSYWVELSAVSGIGDGCPDEQAPYERENIETVSRTITVG